MPTVEEAGVPNCDVVTWWSILGPAALPAHVVSRLNTLINEALTSDAMAKRFADEGAVALPCPPQDFAAMLDLEYREWRKAVHDAGLKLN